MRIHPIRTRTFFISFLLLSGGILFPLALGAKANENIRVLIARTNVPLTIQGQGLALGDLQTGRLLFKNQRSNSLVVKREKGALLKVGGQKVAARSFFLTAGGGSMGINGRRYHNRLRISPGPNGDIWVVNELPMESYLAGLINCEISSQWPMETIKAQAVVARTYATFQKWNRGGELYDVDSTVADQVYEGVEKEDERSHQAVRETAGELLLFGGAPIFSVYHSCCGGRTDTAQHLWAGDYPYLKSIPCNYCLDSPHFIWNYQISQVNLAKTLGMLGLWGSQVHDVAIGQRNESKRVVQLTIQSDREQMKISGKEFRRVLGYDSIRSTPFVVKEENGGFLFSGLGWGHGVGLCQWGARGMADAGENYQAILRYYYPNVAIGKRPR